MTPSRITIIGNGGSGKTTLARRLGEESGIQVHHLDRIQWQPGWVPTPDDVVRARLLEIMDTDQWIIDGLGQMWTIELRVARADRIIFLDFPLEHCQRWAMVRQAEMATVARPDVTEGCLLEGLDQTMMDLLARVDREWMPDIRRLIALPDAVRKVLHVTKPADLERITLESLRGC